MHNMHQWLVVNFESEIRDPRPQLQTTYDGLTIHIQPRNDEYCDAMSTFVRPGEDAQEFRLRLNRFLSAMAWKDGHAYVTRGGIAGGARAVDAENPRFNYREKRHFPGGVVSRFDFEHLFVATDDRQRLALALYREGLNSDNEFYEFLSFYKIVNILHSDPKEQMRWVDANLDKVSHQAADRVKQLRAKTVEIGRYLFVQGRTAIAHAFSQPIRDPDLPVDRTEIRIDCRLMKSLAAILMEEELGIPSMDKIWREHLYELAGFKELLGQELSTKLSQGESFRPGDLPEFPKLTIGLKDHSPYECLSRMEFRVVSCDGGVIILQSDHETQPMHARLELNFPVETLNLDIEEFTFDRNHWKYTEGIADSYYMFLHDFLCNGCLEVLDSMSGDRLSHKTAFIPVNIEFRRTLLNLEISRSIATRRS